MCMELKFTKKIDEQSFCPIFDVEYRTKISVDEFEEFLRWNAGNEFIALLVNSYRKLLEEKLKNVKIF